MLFQEKKDIVVSLDSEEKRRNYRAIVDLLGDLSLGLLGREDQEKFLKAYNALESYIRRKSLRGGVSGIVQSVGLCNDVVFKGGFKIRPCGRVKDVYLDFLDFSRRVRFRVSDLKDGEHLIQSPYASKWK